MDTIKLTLDEAQRLAREVVAEYGAGYIYQQIADEYGNPGCRYIDNGSCSCLVGHILYRAGVPIGDLEGNNNERSVDDDSFLVDVGVDADSRTEHFLSRLQEAQDRGSKWGVALHGAIEAVASYDED